MEPIAVSGARHTADHTPGPWRIVDLPEHDEIQVVAGKDHNEQVIAKIFDTLTDNDMANMRIVAAAPDLLEACEFMLAVLRNDHGPTSWPEVEQMRVAIAKARQ